MSAGVVDGDDVADLDLRQASLDGKFVVVFAQTAGDVVDVIQERVLLAQHRDVVVSAIHGRAHQVGGAGVQTHVFPVDVLFVNDGGD